MLFAGVVTDFLTAHLVLLIITTVLGLVLLIYSVLFYEPQGAIGLESDCGPFYRLGWLLFFGGFGSLCLLGLKWLLT